MSAPALAAAEPELARPLPSKKNIAAAASLRERCATLADLRGTPRPRVHVGGGLPRELKRSEERALALIAAAEKKSGGAGLHAAVDDIARAIGRYSERQTQYALEGLGECCPPGDRCAIHMAHGRRTCEPCAPGCVTHLGLVRRVPEFDNDGWCVVTWEVGPDGVTRLRPGRSYKRRQVPSCYVRLRRAPARCRHATGQGGTPRRSRDAAPLGHVRRPGLRAVTDRCNDCTPTPLHPPKGGSEGEDSSNPPQRAPASPAGKVSPAATVSAGLTAGSVASTVTAAAGAGGASRDDGGDGGLSGKGGADGGDDDDARRRRVEALLASQELGERVRRERERRDAEELAAREAAAEALRRDMSPEALRAKLGIQVASLGDTVTPAPARPPRKPREELEAALARERAELERRCAELGATPYRGAHEPAAAPDSGAPDDDECWLT